MEKKKRVTRGTLSKKSPSMNPIFEVSEEDKDVVSRKSSTTTKSFDSEETPKRKRRFETPIRSRDLETTAFKSSMVSRSVLVKI